MTGISMNKRASSANWSIPESWRSSKSSAISSLSCFEMWRGVVGALGVSFSCPRRSLFTGEEANGSSESSSSLLDTVAGLATLRLLAVEGRTDSFESSSLSITGGLDALPPRVDLRRLATEEATGSSESLSIGELSAFRLSVRRGRDSSSESESSLFSVCAFENCNDLCGLRESDSFASWGSSGSARSRLSGCAAFFLFWVAGMVGSCKDPSPD
jgi:hypothetical protein